MTVRPQVKEEVGSGQKGKCVMYYGKINAGDEWFRRERGEVGNRERQEEGKRGKVERGEEEVGENGEQKVR